MAAERGFEPPVPLANEKVIRDRAEGVIDDSDPNGPTEYRSYAGGATNSGKSTSPTTELRERPMHDSTNLPVPERTGIPGDCATLFVSLELSRSTWVATSLAPGSKKMSKHTLAGGNGRELLDLLARLKTRAEQRIAAPVRVVAIQEVGSMVSGFIACSRTTAARATSSILRRLPCHDATGAPRRMRSTARRCCAP